MRLLAILGRRVRCVQSTQKLPADTSLSQKSLYSTSRNDCVPDTQSTQQTTTQIEHEPSPSTAPFNAAAPSLTSSSQPTVVFEARVARIFRPARNVMQSGTAATRQWRLSFNPDVPRWENPVMGWTSSRDPVQAVQFTFPTKEHAITYAQQQGWAYEVAEADDPVRRPKNYAENFTYSSGKLRIIKTK